VQRLLSHAIPTVDVKNVKNNNNKYSQTLIANLWLLLIMDQDEHLFHGGCDEEIRLFFAFADFSLADFVNERAIRQSIHCFYIAGIILRLALRNNMGLAYCSRGVPVLNRDSV
jgi:hypothetical protein